MLIIISEDDEFIFNLNADMLPQLVQTVFHRRPIKHSIQDQELLRIAISLLGGPQNPSGALVFCSHYSDSSSNQVAVPVLRTMLSIDGDVLLSVREDILSEDTALKIAIGHNYLVEKLMQQSNGAIATYLRAQLQPWLGLAFLFGSIFAYAPLVYIVWQLAIASQSPQLLDPNQLREYQLANAAITNLTMRQFLNACQMALLPPLLVILHRPVFKLLGQLMLKQLASGKGLFRDITLHAFARLMA